jgi:hypothetical protein
VNEDELRDFLDDELDKLLSRHRNPYESDGGGSHYIWQMAEDLAESLRKAGWVK